MFAHIKWVFAFANAKRTSLKCDASSSDYRNIIQPARQTLEQQQQPAITQQHQQQNIIIFLILYMLSCRHPSNKKNLLNALVPLCSTDLRAVDFMGIFLFTVGPLLSMQSYSSIVYASPARPQNAHPSGARALLDDRKPASRLGTVPGYKASPSKRAFTTAKERERERAVV